MCSHVWSCNRIIWHQRSTQEWSVTPWTLDLSWLVWIETMMALPCIIPAYYISYDIIAFTYHSTTFKLFKTVQLVTFPSEYSSHIVALSLALAESFTIKRTPNILIIAVCLFIWQALWLTASSLFDVMQPMVFPCPIKTSHKIPIWTGCPLVSAIVK